MTTNLTNLTQTKPAQLLSRRAPISMHTLQMLVVAITAIVLSGCASNARTYPEHTAEDVWVAMTAVAESPDYEGHWYVTDNKVAADIDAGRIDIQRTLRRTVYQPDSEARPERRDWNYTITLDQRNPPVVSFEAHGWAIPAYKQFEVDRFFLDLDRLLSVGDAIETDANGKTLQAPDGMKNMDDDLPSEPVEPDEPAGSERDEDTRAAASATGVQSR